MNYNKYLKILIVILICILAIGAVSAQDSDADDVSADADAQIEEISVSNGDSALSEDDAEDEISVMDGEDVLADTPGTFTELKSIIDGNGSASTVYLSRNYTAVESDSLYGGITLYDNMTIDGQGHTIDGNNLCRIFNVNQANSIVLKNMNIVNAKTGVINFENVKNATVDNVRFIDNHVSQGIIIFAGHDYGHLTVSNTEFINSSITSELDEWDNEIQSMPLMGVDMRGGGDVSFSKVNFTNTVFNDVSPMMIYAIDGITLDDVQFINASQYEEWYYYIYTRPSGAGPLMYLGSYNIEISNMEFNDINSNSVILAEATNITIDGVNLSDANIGNLFDFYMISPDGSPFALNLSNLNADNVTSLRELIYEEVIYMYDGFMEADTFIRVTAEDAAVSMNNLSISNIYVNYYRIIDVTCRDFTIDNFTIINYTANESHWMVDDNIDEETGNPVHTESIENMLGESVIIRVNAADADISNIAVDNAVSNGLKLVNVVDNENLTLCNVNLTNSNAGSSESLIYAMSDAVLVENILINNVYGSTDEFTNSSMELSIRHEEFGVNIFGFEGENCNLTINNVDVINSVLSYFIDIAGVNSIDIGDVCVADGYLMDNEYLFSMGASGNITLMDILVNNITIVPYKSYSYYESEYKEGRDVYYQLNNDSMSLVGSGNPGFRIESEGCVSLTNVSLTNSEANSVQHMISIGAYGDITVKDMTVENISEKICTEKNSYNSVYSVDYYNPNKEDEYEEMSEDSFYESSGMKCDNSIYLFSEFGNIIIDSLLINNVSSNAIKDNNLEYSEYFEYFLNITGMNVTIADLIINNSAIGGYNESAVYVVANGYLSIDNFVLNNITSNDVKIDEKSSGMFSDSQMNMTFINSGAAGISLKGVNGTNISNLQITNTFGGSDYGLLSIYSYGNNTLENITIDNIVSRMPVYEIHANETMNYDGKVEHMEEDVKFTAENVAPINGITIEGDHTVITNINMTNFKVMGSTDSANGNLLHSQAADLKITNMIVENITELPQNMILLLFEEENYDYAYQNYSGIYSPSMLFMGENVALAGISISNVDSAGASPLITVQEIDNFYLYNAFVTDSRILMQGESSSYKVPINIVARGDVVIDNFTANNITDLVEYNSSISYPDGNQTDYARGSENTGFGINIVSPSNLNLSNVNIANVCGSPDGIINVDNLANDAFVDNVLVENVSSFNYFDEYGSERNTSSKAMVIITESGNAFISNVVLNNFTSASGENFVYLLNQNATVENFTVSNIQAGVSYASFYDSESESDVILAFDGFDKLIYFKSNLNDGNVNITNLTVANVPAGQHTVNIEGRNVNLTDSTFKDIAAESHRYDNTPNDELQPEYRDSNSGMGVYIDALNNVAIVNATFENISLTDYALSVNVAEGGIIIENSSFIDVHAVPYNATDYEGDTEVGSYVEENTTSKTVTGFGAPITVIGSEFINCSADYGGALYIDGSAAYNIVNSTFTNNKASYGGAIYLNESADGNVIYNSTFEYNTAAFNGGAIYINDGENTDNVINESTFTQNHAMHDGGAFFYSNRFVDVLFDDYQFEDRNLITEDGFRTFGDYNTKILNSLFNDNSDYSLAIVAQDIGYGVNQTVNVTVDTGVEGQVMVNITDMNGNFVSDINGNEVRNRNYTMTGGVASIPLGILDIGTYNVSAYFNNYNSQYDDYYDYAYHYNSTVFHVTLELINVTVNETYFADENATVTAEVNANATGTVNITISNATFTLTIPEIAVENGTAAYNFTGLWAGAYQVNVTYNGDSRIPVLSNVTSFTVLQRKSLVNVTAENIVYGKNATVIVKVPEGQKGNVTIRINGTDHTKEILEGEVEFIIENLTVQKWDVNVTFEENRIYSPNTNRTSFNVTKANLTAEVTGENVTVEENLTFTVDVTDDFKGNISITVDGETLYNASAEKVIELGKLLAGNKTAVVEFYGDGNYKNLTLEVNFTVSRIDSYINVTVDNVTYPETPIAIVNVSGKANGTVEITVGDKTFSEAVSNGHAEVSLDGLSAGVKVADVNFISGDFYNKNATNSAVFEIYRAQSYIIITNEESDIVATLPENATGSVIFYVGGNAYPVELTGNVAVLENNLTIGSNNVVVSYDGDANFTASINVTNLVIDKLESFVNASADNITYGNDSLITVKVPAAQTGNVTVTVNNISYIKEIDGGIAQFNITGLEPGHYDVSVTYLGNENYTSVSNATSFNVTDRITPDIKIEAPRVIEIEGSFILNVTVVPDLELTVTVNGAEIELADGQYLFEANEAGTFTVVATTEESGEYYPGYAQVTFEVIKHNSTVEIEPVGVHYVGDEFEITVKSNATVNVTVNGKSYSVIDGVVDIPTSELAAGEYVIVAEVFENEMFNGDIRSETFSIVKADAVIESVDVTESVTVGDNAEINVTLNVESGKLLIEINGMNYTVDINDFNATLSLVLPVGEYPVKVYYLGDEKYNSAENLSAGVINVADKYACAIVISVDKVWVVDDTVIFEVTTNSTADLTVKVNGNDPNAMGDGKYNFTADSVGVYTITAETDENDYYHAGSQSETFTVIKHNSTVEIAPIETYYVGEEFTITVNSNTTVNVTINGKAYEVVDGKVTVSGLDAGEYTVNAIVFENDKYNGNAANATFNVIKYDSFVIVEADSINAGETAVIKVTAPDDTEAMVILYIGDINYEVDIVNGSGELKLSGLDQGNYSIAAVYLENDKYFLEINYTSFNVSKVDAKASLDVEDSTVGEHAIITVTIPEDANGEVTVTVGNITKTVPVTGGENQIVIDGLPEGEHNVTAVYDGGDKYSPQTLNGTINVTPAKPDEPINHEVNVTIENVTSDSAIAVIEVADNMNGEVNITVDGKTFPATVENGTAVVPLENLTPGKHDVSVIFEGDDNTVTTAQTTVDIPKEETEVKVSVEVDGDKVTVSVELPEDATGPVLIDIDGKGYYAPVEDGKAVLDITDLAPGDHTVKATYPGDDKYDSASDEDNFAVPKTSHEVNVTAGENAVEVDVGDEINGTVTVSVDGKEYTAPVVNGKAVVPVDNLTPGAHEIEAVVKGDDNTTSAAKTTVDIPKEETEAKVSVEVDGDKVTVSVELPEDATGPVLIDVDGKGYYAPVEDGKAVLDITDLAPGDHTVKATYQGDDKYNSASDEDNFTVPKTSHDVNVTAGENAVEVDVGDDINGTVTVTVDGKNYTASVVNGKAVVPVDNLTPGAHEIEAFVKGDDNTTSVAKTTVDVPKEEAVANVTVSAAEGIVTVELPEDATGVVLIDVDGKGYYAPVENGKAVLNVTDLAPGDHTVKATYPGDDKYNSASDEDNFTVPKTSHDVNVTAGENAVEVDVGDNINGTVTVTVDGKNYTASVVNGKAVVPVDNLTPGSHEIEAVVKGDDNTTSAAKTTVDVPKEDAAADINITSDENGTFVSVDLPDDATGVVLVDVDGKGYYANVSDGKAVIPIDDLAPGNHTIRATYLGDDKYNESTASKDISIPKKSIATVIVVEKKFTRVANDWNAGERGAFFYGVLMDTDGNLLANKMVQIAVNGPIYNVTTDEEGRAGLQVNLANANTYTYALVFAGDDVYNASHIASTKLTVTKKSTSITASAKSFKASAKTKTVSVTLKTSKNPYDGKTYLSSGKKITLTVAGKTYTAKTDAKGVAKFNIKLTKKGTYTAKISFAGDKTYSASSKNVKITIK